MTPQRWRYDANCTIGGAVRRGIHACWKLPGLSVLYGAAAGGLATPAGVPFNPLAISLLDQLTGYKISFAQWTLTGAILAAATIPAYFLVLKIMSPPEVKTIIGGSAYFIKEKQTLGPLGTGEKNVLFVLIVMVVLWFLPGFIRIPVVDIWYVPPLAMALLFLLPVNARSGEMTLNAKDFQDGVPWNVLFWWSAGQPLQAAWCSSASPTGLEV